MRSEYDLDYSKAVRGKYYRRLLEGRSNVVVLDPDIARRFRTSTAVNEALRGLLKAQRTTNARTHERTKRKS
ncbi:MAG TPA: hypothetical protein VMU03_16105 [Gammaproteobacteria bacterium]|nr:hypothetical protein [Gammaproteobacteria bacterium]